MTSKRCPSCNTIISLSRDSPDGTCTKCGKPYKIQKKLRDTDRHRGGFKLINPEKYFAATIPDILILKYIQQEGTTYQTQISTHFHYARATVSRYIKKLTQEGLISTEVQGKYLRVRLTEQGALLCPAN